MKILRLIAAFTCFLLGSLSVHADEPRFFTHTVEARDTLMKLANRYLINRGDWQIFQKFNAVKNPRAMPLGSLIRIPVSAMRADIAAAEVIATQGTVTSSAGPVATGSKISEGGQLTTGDASFITIKLADGSTLTVQPKSIVRLETARQLVNTGGVTDTVVRLDSGRIETSAAKQKNSGARYEIRTPTSNMGVRGTIFRVAADESGKRGQGEVVEGLVAVTSGTAPAQNSVSNAAVVALRTGFGTFVEAGKAPSPPIALLAAPDVSTLGAQFQKPEVRFAFPSVPAAVAYRAQVAIDGTFTNLLANASSDTADVAFANLPDGDLFARFRGVDVNGLEGKDATHAFTVRARPLPPSLTAPRGKTGFSDGRVKLVWQASADAVAYRVQLSEDALFAKPVVDEQVALLVMLSPAITLKPTPYFWRVAAVNAKGNTGPWSETLSFVGAADAPVLKMASLGGSRSLEIDGSTTQSYQVQIAHDDRFANMVSDRVILGNKLDLAGLSVNAYYIRVRAVGGTWSEPRLLEIYPLGGGWWLSTQIVPKHAVQPAAN